MKQVNGAQLDQEEQELLAGYEEAWDSGWYGNQPIDHSLGAL